MDNYRDAVLRELSSALLALDMGQIEKLADEVKKARKVFCDGLGRSRLAMEGFAMRLNQMGIPCAMVGEVTAPALGKGDLLVACTASGSSPVLLYHAQRAKAYGGRIMLITGKEKSPLWEEAAGVILIKAPDKDSQGGRAGSIQPMGTLFEQTSQAVCDIACLRLMEKLHITAEEMRKRHANIE